MVEVLIRRHLAAHFPDDGILGEEDGLTEGRSGGIWVVDPIDGTREFVAGIPEWCVSIGLIERLRKHDLDFREEITGTILGAGVADGADATTTSA